MHENFKNFEAKHVCMDLAMVLSIDRNNNCGSGEATDNCPCNRVNGD